MDRADRRVRAVAETGIAERLARLPRFPLARLPTPLHDAPRLRDALGGARRCPRILIKRDDLTDLALGGNKARKLEFLLGDAIRAGATALVTTGAVQSNHARMTAAAAGRAGMRASLVLTADSNAPELQGNLLLDRLLGAHVHVLDVDVPPEAESAAVSDVLRGLRAAGETPYAIALGGSCGIGTLGYVDATRELLAQLRELGCAPVRLYYGSGSRGTQAGLELGARLFHAPWQCVGIAVSGGESEKLQRAVRIAQDAAALLGVSADIEGGALLTDQDHYGDGYARPTAAGLEAIRLLASTEGILLDPVYTAKAMAGMIDHVRRGVMAPEETLVFLHTGGVPGLFGQAARLAPLL